MPESEPNEILAAAADAKAARARVAENVPGRKWPLGAIGLGVGIGSAAIAAAMLFARGRKDD